MNVAIPTTGKPCTKCNERDGNPTHNGICNVCYSNEMFGDPEKYQAQNVSSGPKRNKNSFAIWGFILGIASVFLGMGLLPIIAIVLSAIGINKTKKTNTGRWMAVTGLVLGILYFIVYLYNYGYILD